MSCCSTLDSDKITSLLTVFVFEFTANFVVSPCPFCKLQRGLGFFCFVNHFSYGGVNANHNVTGSLSLGEILRVTLDCTRIAKDFMMVGEFLSNEGGTQTLASDHDKNKKDHKHLRSKRLKPVVDYCQKQNDHKQRVFKHKTKKTDRNRTITNHKLRPSEIQQVNMCFLRGLLR